MTRVGAIFIPQHAPEQLRGVARAADAAGVDELWLWEDCFFEAGVSAAAAALAWTERISVGIGLMPTPLRNVALTAMEVSTMARLFPGRLLPGIGHGVQPWMAQVGAKASSPLTLLREQATALRSLLDGERVSVGGRYVTLDDVALDWPPQSRVPVLIGAEGPKSLHLAGEVGDGTILPGGTTPARLHGARRLIDAGREAAGRSDHHDVTVFVPAATGPGAAQRIARNQEAWSFDAREHLSVHGSAEQVAEGLAPWVEAGADAVALQPTADDPDPEAFMAFVGEEVLPLLA